MFRSRQVSGSIGSRLIDGRRRIEPQRLLEGGAGQRHGVQPFDRIGLARQHRVDLLLDRFALPRRFGEAVDGPAESARRGLVAGADEGDDVVLDLAARQPVRSFGAQQQGEEILRHVFAALHATLAQVHRVGNDLAEIAHGLAAAQTREARQPFRRAQEVERIDAAHGLQEMIDLLGEAAGLAGDLAGLGVTADVTRRTMRIQADHLLRGYRNVVTRLQQTIAISDDQAGVPADYRAWVARAARPFADARADLERRFGGQSYRIALGVIGERLERTRAGWSGGEAPAAARMGLRTS